MSRGWTPIEDDKRWDDDGYYDKVRSRCDFIASEWSRIHDTAEKAYFQRQSDYEFGFNDYEFEDEEEEAQFKWARQLHDNMENAKIEVLEKELNELGARMMRPYEHWNEDEKYMQYMENRGY